MDITHLIATLRSHGATSFEGYGIKISFDSKSDRPEKEPTDRTLTPEKKAQTTEPQAADQAPGTDQMQADETMEYQKILDWSVGGEGSLPLTGEGATQ